MGRLMAYTFNGLNEPGNRLCHLASNQPSNGHQQDHRQNHSNKCRVGERDPIWGEGGSIYFHEGMSQNLTIVAANRCHHYNCAVRHVKFLGFYWVFGGRHSYAAPVGSKQKSSCFQKGWF